MLKEYVIDLRGYDGKLRKLISTGLQEHGFRLGWKGIPSKNPGKVAYTDEPVLYFDNDENIRHSSFVDGCLDNTPISPADFLALTTEDVQDNSGTASAACTDKKPGFEPKQWVLGRDNPNQCWCLDRFSHYTDDLEYICLGRCMWEKIIPYEGNEHLCGQVGEP
jgi:hypothetical protein